MLSCSAQRADACLQGGLLAVRLRHYYCIGLSIAESHLTLCMLPVDRDPAAMLQL